MRDGRIALVTCRALPEGTDDDRLLLEPLRRLGFQPVFVAWDAPGVEWPAFDAAVVRSTWDYHHRPAAFLEWVERRAESGVRLWNPPDVLTWNHHKSYLRTLEGRGVRVVATRWLPRGAPDLVVDRALETPGRLVVKPAVSAGAHRTWILPHDEPRARRLLQALVRRLDVLVQPFAEEIVTEGEWSLVFLDGRYSHAGLKRPAAGEFRVQEHLGGIVAAAVPPRQLVDDAAAAVAAVSGDLLYARVDGVRRAGRLHLLELEALEPSLFLRLDAAAPRRLASAIAARVGRRTRARA